VLLNQHNEGRLSQKAGAYILAFVFQLHKLFFSMVGCEDYGSFIKLLEISFLTDKMTRSKNKEVAWLGLCS
jgi:hypothetical protein